MNRQLVAWAHKGRDKDEVAPNGGRGNGVTTHLPSEAMADRASLPERRARLGPWIRFADEAQIVGGVCDGTRLCTVCNRMIGEGELDFLVVLAGAVALRVDRECLDLWHEAVTKARHHASTDLGCEWPGADEDHGHDDDKKIQEELAAAIPLTPSERLAAFPPDLRPTVGTCAGL